MGNEPSLPTIGKILGTTLQFVDVLDYFCVAYIIYGCPELPLIYGCPELPRLVPLGLHVSPQVALSIQEKIL